MQTFLETTQTIQQVIINLCVLQAIDLALEQAGGASAESTIFLDDSTRNIAAGHQRGLLTVLVSQPPRAKATMPQSVLHMLK